MATSVTASSAALASLCSTTRATVPSASRITRPYPVGSSITLVSRVAAAAVVQMRARRARRVLRWSAAARRRARPAPSLLRPAPVRRVPVAPRARCRAARPARPAVRPARPARGARSTSSRRWPTTTTVLRGVQRPRRGEHVLEHRAAGEAVQHLRQGRRLHPGALARGEDDDREGRSHAGFGHAVGSPFARVDALWLGDSDSNRDCTAPKAGGLPITPSPTRLIPDHSISSATGRRAGLGGLRVRKLRCRRRGRTDRARDGPCATRLAKDHG